MLLLQQFCLHDKGKKKKAHDQKLFSDKWNFFELLHQCSKCYHLLFAFAEPMPGVPYPLLKLAKAKGREQENV